MNINPATPNNANDITSLICTAMTDECIQHFCGPQHTINEFHTLMNQLVLREDTQYSYKNALIAEDNGQVIGLALSYNGAHLLTMREIFISEAHKAFGIDHSNMPQETQPGELYLDSLAVIPSHRGQGIATALLNATAQKAKQLNLPAVGLLVDNNNPLAEQLYLRAGFQQVGINQWGGHPMKHLQRPV